MGGWLAGLDAFAVGVAYLGALLTTRFVVRPLLVNLLGGAPVVGGWLTQNIDSRLSAFERSITPAANASMGTIISALDWLVAQGRALLGSLSALGDAVTTALYHLATTSVPHALGVSVQWVESLVEAARGWALLQVQAAEVRLGGEVAYAEAQASNLVAAARSEALSEVQAAERIVLDEIRKAEGVTGQLFRQAEYDAGQLAAVAEVRSAELVAAARQELQAEVTAVEHDLQQLGKAVGVAIEDTTATLGGDIAAAEARFGQTVGGLEASVQAEIDKVLASGPWSGLVAEYEGGQELLKLKVLELVLPAAKAIRQQLADVEALRAKYGPEIRAAGEALRVDK